MTPVPEEALEAYPWPGLQFSGAHQHVFHRRQFVMAEYQCEACGDVTTHTFPGGNDRHVTRYHHTHGRAVLWTHQGRGAPNAFDDTYCRRCWPDDARPNIITFRRVTNTREIAS